MSIPKKSDVYNAERIVDITTARFLAGFFNLRYVNFNNTVWEILDNGERNTGLRFEDLEDDAPQAIRT